MKRLDWFLERIRKKVYRNKSTCECRYCIDTYKNGLIIEDRTHAQYLYDIEMESIAEGD